MWIRGVAPSSAPAAVPLDSPSASWSRGPTSISPTIKVENGHLPLLAVDAMLVICRIRDMASEELLAQKGSPARSWPAVVSLDRGAEQETGPQQDSREGDHTMARKTIGAWIHQALGGHKTGAATAGIGNQVLTNEGTVLGTITAVWKGADATDHASHEDTLCVQRPEQDEAGMLYIPSDAIARVSDQGVVLTVDATQVTARGWRFRPTWLPQRDPGEVSAGANTGQPLE